MFVLKFIIFKINIFLILTIYRHGPVGASFGISSSHGDHIFLQNKLCKSLQRGIGISEAAQGNIKFAKPNTLYFNIN